MDISFIIVSYNTCDVTLACVKHILASVPSGINFEVIVIDNNSSDQTVACLAKEVPDVRVFSNEMNRGYGAAHNIGASLACGDKLFLLNSDFFINSASVQSAFDELRVMPDQIIGFRQVLETGIQQRCIGVLPGLIDLILDLTALKRIAYRYSLRSDSDAASQDVRGMFFLDGAGLAISAKNFAAIGRFDERFFFYAEDADLCFQARKHKLRQSILVGEPCIHYRGYTAKQIDSDYKFKSRYYVESYLKFCRKNRTIVEFAAVKILLPIKFGLYALGFFLLSVSVGCGAGEI